MNAKQYPLELTNLSRDSSDVFHPGDLVKHHWGLNIGVVISVTSEFVEVRWSHDLSDIEIQVQNVANTVRTLTKWNVVP